jgi:response regulator RpfG family c-di-GMP phosphodiesterase
VTDHAHLRLVVDRRAEDIARAVALIAGAREGYAPARVARMAEAAGAIATAAGLDEAAASRCVVAAWLHDIGMVALPDEVLAPSDPAGYVDSPLVRAHAELGADLVTRVPELAPVADAVRHHHERYDGSGYPDRLAGEAIPFGARIMGVADAFDALTSSRSYRDSLTSPEALGVLDRETQVGRWDPRVMAALRELVARVGAAEPAS